jgi:hypothetical protein
LKSGRVSGLEACRLKAGRAEGLQELEELGGLEESSYRGGRLLRDLRGILHAGGSGQALRPDVGDLSARAEA